MVSRARALIRSNFSRSLDLEAFALGLGVTPRTLARRFQTSIGMSPKAYHQHLRLASAQSMLVRTSRPVARIAAMVGYADTAFFCDLFKRRVGETPKAFRDRARRVSHPR
jgi:transcriptional regulator GlxA family with amidase domain